ncbi:MAG: NUDIX domain-containing protein [Dysosmobacter sp.]
MKMPMDLTEVKLRRKDVFEGKIMTVHVDDVRLPNGEEATREVVDHVDGAAVLALDEANRVLVVRQYRYVFGKVLDELPAGKLDPGEDPVTGALRELKEETGAEPETFLPLGKLLPAPGCYGKHCTCFWPRGCKFSQQQLDPDEFLNVERIPFDEMVHRCVNGEIDDAKTSRRSPAGQGPFEPVNVRRHLPWTQKPNRKPSSLWRTKKIS